MSHVFEIPDAIYKALAEIAAKQGQTPEEAFRAWVTQMQARTVSAEVMAGPMNGVYDASLDPLASFLGAFQADSPDVVRRHDDYLGEAYADTHDPGE